MIFILVGILDSGLGAISVLNELIKQKKHNEYILYLDYKNNPFGNKKETELINILKNGIKFLKSKGCKIIIIACNTLSIIALKYKIEDVIIPLKNFKKVIQCYFDDNSILLATNFTIESNYYNVNGRKSSDIVSYIEGNTSKCINDIVKEFSDKKKVFLGCTHFNLISNKLKNKIIFDSGKVLADNFNIYNEKLSVNVYVTNLNKNIFNHLMHHIHLKKLTINGINI